MTDVARLKPGHSKQLMKEHGDMIDYDSKIRTALLKKLKENDSSSYHILLSELQSCSDFRELSAIFHALSQQAGIIAQYHESLQDLLNLLFMFDWSGDEQVAVAFEALLCSLVSANAGFVEACFQLLIQNLLPPEEDDESIEDKETETTNDKLGDRIDENEQGDAKSNAAGEERERKRNEFIHKAIRAILRTIPLGCSTLLPVIIEHYPLIWLPLQVQKVYVIEVLKISEYVPVLRDRILAQTFEKVLAIDMEIRFEDLEESIRNEYESAQESGVFSMDEMCSEDSGKNNNVDTSAKTLRRVRELAEKVDELLNILFQYCDNQCTKGSNHSMRFFILLLNLFDQYILRTRRCNFVQFIVLYVCRRRAEFVELFQGRMLKYMMSSSFPPDLRVQATGYLASFLARSLYIKSELLHATVKSLVDWLHQYLKNHGNMSSQYFHPGIHEQYYLTWQCFIYILVYKGMDFPVEILSLISWKSFAENPLNPFPLLPRYLMEEFVNLMVRRKAVFESSSGDLRSLIAAMNQIPVNIQVDNPAVLYDGSLFVLYYPFDPCLLEKTFKTIEPFYQNWFSLQSQGNDQYYYDSDGNVEPEKETIDEEFSSESLLVDRSELPPAIRIPTVASRARYLLGGADEVLRATKYRGFSVNTAMSSIESGGMSETQRRVSVASSSYAHESTLASSGPISTVGNRRYGQISRREMKVETSSQASGSW